MTSAAVLLLSESAAAPPLCLARRESAKIFLPSEMQVFGACRDRRGAASGTATAAGVSETATRRRGLTTLAESENKGRMINASPNNLSVGA